VQLDRSTGNERMLDVARISQDISGIRLKRPRHPRARHNSVMRVKVTILGSREALCHPEKRSDEGSLSGRGFFRSLMVA